MKLLLLITAQVESGLEIAQAWQENGAPGVTLVRSHGLHRLNEAAKRSLIDLPLATVSIAGALARLIDNMEYNTEIVMSAVEDVQVDPLVKIAEEALGNLDSPNSGILLVLDIEKAIGVSNRKSTR